MAIACKAGSARVVAAFPSVCQSPPGPPSGPLPVPYPLSSFSRDLKQGSKRVKIGGQPVALYGKSYYVSKPLGNEAATRSFGASMVNHQLVGKTKYAAGSIDVRFESAKVCRHLDVTTSNHGSDPGEGPSPGVEDMGPPARPGKLERCPCCNGELHANQFDPDTGEPYEVIDELEWYASGHEHARAIYAKKTTPEAVSRLRASKSPGEAERIMAEIERKFQDVEQAMTKLRAARDRGMDCPNLHKPGDSCGIHLKKTNPLPATRTKADRARIGFTSGVATESRREWRAKGFSMEHGSEIIHKTPLAAGGCPKAKNTVPKAVLNAECMAIENAQSKLQSHASFSKS